MGNKAEDAAYERTVGDRRREDDNSDNLRRIADALELLNALMAEIAKCATETAEKNQKIRDAARQVLKVRTEARDPREASDVLIQKRALAMQALADALREYDR